MVMHVQTGSSIQTAIAAAPPGAVISVPAGEWRGDLRIDKPLTIAGAGAGRTRIVGTSPGYPVVWISGVQTGSVRISDLTVTGAQAGSCGDPGNDVCADGIRVQDRVRLVLTDCTVTGNARYGVYADGTAHVVLARGTVSHNRFGIRLEDSAGARVDTATIAENGFGIALSGGASATVMGCTVAGNAQEGVIVADSAHLTLERTAVRDNGRGGVYIDARPCYATPRAFTGMVRGGANVIPGPTSADGNKEAAVCPGALRFLSTSGGGVYPDPTMLLTQLPIPPPEEGDPHAPVTIVEFSDFTCPYCARFARDTLPKLRANYIEPGKVRLFFLPYPVHGTVAEKETEAGFCAQAQGCFWKLHDRMFADLFVHGFPHTFDPVRVRAIAAAAGCDPGAIAARLSSGTYAAAVQESISIAHKLGVEGTPTFFIDGMKVFGAVPYAVFSRIIDSELAVAQPRSP